MGAPWAPSQEDVRAALDLLGSTDAGRIKDAAKRIRDHKTELPGAMKDKLRAAAKVLAKAEAAVKGIAGERDPLRSALEERRRRYEAQARRRSTSRRGGGGKVAANKMRFAAWEAYELLWDNDIVPTLTLGQPYLTLTALLYQMATNQRRDPAHACATLFKELNWRGGEATPQRRQIQEKLEEQLGQLSDEELAQLRLSRRSN